MSVSAPLQPESFLVRVVEKPPGVARTDLRKHLAKNLSRRLVRRVLFDEGLEREIVDGASRAIANYFLTGGGGELFRETSHGDEGVVGRAGVEAHDGVEGRRLRAVAGSDWDDVEPVDWPRLGRPQRQVRSCRFHGSRMAGLTCQQTRSALPDDPLEVLPKLVAAATSFELRLEEALKGTYFKTARTSLPGRPYIINKITFLSEKRTSAGGRSEAANVQPRRRPGGVRGAALEGGPTRPAYRRSI